jgi:hypothetical protein
MALPIMKHDPISAFLALSSLIIPFLLWEDTFLGYLLILTPLYLPYKSFYLSGSLALCAFLWPHVTERNLMMRAFLLMNAIYIAITRNRQQKYKMTPTQVENSEFPILI